jgi:hypothetical protein
MIVRLALLPAKVGLKTTALGVKAGAKTTALGVKTGAKTTAFGMKTGYRAGRLLGYRRLAVLAVGIGIGLLIAPVPGRQLRARLRALLDQSGVAGLVDGELAERVRFELAHASGTWHLPQPEVAALAGTVVLTGEVPDATARAEIEHAAAGVPGVATVDNQLRLAGTRNGH